MSRICRLSCFAGFALATAASPPFAPFTYASAAVGPARATRSDQAGPQAKARNDYAVVALDSDGSVEAPIVDEGLINAWGLTLSGTGVFWVVNNGTDRASTYTGDGVPQSLVVLLPTGAAPTGVAFYAGNNFVLNDGPLSGPARFIIAGNSGEIYGWGPAVSPPGHPANALMVVDKSASGATYKGLAVAATGAGDRLYATDFRNRKVDVFDGCFEPVALATAAFVDPGIPSRFAPFGIANIEGRIFVTFAKRDSDGEVGAPGWGRGFVSVFDTDGAFIARLGTRGALNMPWGLAMAPAPFGRFGGDLLVGNSGDGRIVAYRVADDFRSAFPEGVLRGADRRTLVIEGLRGIRFGNGARAAPSDTLFFTAGPGDERHGLFGRIERR